MVFSPKKYILHVTLEKKPPHMFVLILLKIQKISFGKIYRNKTPHSYFC